MTKLRSLLAGDFPPAVYRFESRAASSAIARAAERHSWRPFFLDGRAVTDKASFLQGCAAALQLPAYFGHNWDALEESLTDLSWVPAEGGYLLLYDQVGRFAAAQPDEWGTARAILAAAVERWRPTATPLVVLLRGVGATAEDLPVL